MKPVQPLPNRKPWHPSTAVSARLKAKYQAIRNGLSKVFLNKKKNRLKISAGFSFLTHQRTSGQPSPLLRPTVTPTVLSAVSPAASGSGSKPYVTRSQMNARRRARQPAADAPTKGRQIIRKKYGTTNSWEEPCFFHTKYLNLRCRCIPARSGDEPEEL